MSGSGLVWIRSPQVLIDGLSNYQNKMFVALQAMAMEWGQRIQNAARKSAHWTDRTGNARSGIFFAVDANGLGIQGTLGDIALGARGQVLKFGGRASRKSTNRRSVSVSSRDEQDFQVVSAGPNTIAIYLSHTMYYGKWLELSNGGKYAIIASTMEGNLPMLESMLQRLVRD